MIKEKERREIWRGHDRHYYQVHQWLIRHHGKATTCENEKCERVGEKRYEWALKKGFEYKRCKDNFMMLCPSCHRKYDQTDQMKNKISAARKEYFRLNGALSPETRKKISDSSMGVHNVAVIKLGLDNSVLNEYPSVSIAAKENGILQSAISNALTKLSKKAGGYKWQYKRKICE